MKNIGGNRSTLGFVNPLGSNGNTITAPIVTESLVSGTTDVSHALGKEPAIVKAYDETGTPLLIDWQPKSGSETTIVEITFPVASSNVKFEISANA